ncbi:MAG: hypothetical protein AAGD10_21965 [Myxococcota bacterium]
MSGLLGLWSNGEGSASALLDVVLMTALAEGRFDQAQQDRVGRILRDAPDLADTDWDRVLERVEVLGLQAPLFSETRQELPGRIPDPRSRRRALELGWQAMGDPPSDEARAVLGGIAQSLGISELELECLAKSEVGPGLSRSQFNDPAHGRKATLFTALEAAPDDEQRGLVLFKIDGVRRLLWRLEGSTRIVSFAERLRFEELVFRVDVILEHAMRRRLVRILAPGEALHAEEHRLMRLLTERLPDAASLLVAHFGPLGPADRSFLMGFDPDRLESIQL